ncbi:hypothetical protein VTL71DRAFT_8899 [Oculimacula yallundae]|uniref:Uncharacterized protein n=1 Tax=Oculimacula yallundae TaxID=86028 RepID=A0ABR4BT63_9HELO
MVVKLPYTLHTRYRSIAIAWTIILIPPIFINLGLFYGLWYGRPQMDRILVLTLPTAILGIFTIIAILERIYKLVQPSPEYRPVNSPRYALDIFQWGYFGALILISSLISSTLLRDDRDHDGHEYQIRLLSLPASVLMYYLATLTALSLLLNSLSVKLPFRFGSSEPGNVVKPAIFYIVEDIVAVDGNGGLSFRTAFNARYESSVVFREMIWKLSLAWCLAFYVLAGAFTALVFWLEVDAVYAVGWVAPFPLAGALAVWTISFVRAELREERRLEEAGEDGGRNGEENGAVRVDGDERAPLLGSVS